jgi:pyrroloquinoline quinone (PQQ) biosynthesis protein C
MLSIIEAPLTRAAFEAALLAAIERYRCEDTRFYRLTASGRCPPAVLRRYARSTYLSACLFCASLAELADKAPDGAARLILIENLLEEEGISFRPDKGLVVRPERRHPALALRFVKACGGDEEEPANALHATAPGRAMLAEGRWLEAVAFLLVGQELRFAAASGLILAALRPYGFADRDLAFFAVHGEADCRHGREALDLVLDRARSHAEQQGCIVAAGDGARHWFELHGSSAGLRRAA